jgi:hypothetical protein
MSLAFFRRFLRPGSIAPAALSIGIGLSLAFVSSPAAAVDAEVNSTTAAQSYELSSPWGGLTLKRRRILQTLGLGLYHLEGGEPQAGGPDVSVRLRMRLDADPGIKSDETTYATGSDRFVPGLAIAPIDIMYGYVEGRRLAGGWLGFRLGRQYVTDSLGWWSFDGGLVRITTPVFVEVEAYGGLEQRGGLPLSSPRFERNGIWRGDRKGIETGVYPQFQKAAIAPAYGVALQSTGVTWLHGRLDYRKVLNQGESVVSVLTPDPVTGNLVTYNGTRTSSERIGYALDATAASIGGVKGGLVYDLLEGGLSSWYGQADWYATRGITLSGDYDYFRPTFDGDSIFNFFTHNAMKTLTGRLAVDVTEGVDVAASGGIRTYTTTGTPGVDLVADSTTGVLGPTQATQQDILANLAGRYRFDSGLLGVRGMSETGDRGRRQGGELQGEHSFLGRRWTALGRLSVYDWEDKLRPDRNATSFGYVIGGAFRPSPVAEAMVEWEHDMNRLVGQRFRILALLNLTVTK